MKQGKRTSETSLIYSNVLERKKSSKNGNETMSTNSMMTSMMMIDNMIILKTMAQKG